jgi:hypothetical protein
LKCSWRNEKTLAFPRRTTARYDARRSLGMAERGAARWRPFRRRAPDSAQFGDIGGDWKNLTVPIGIRPEAWIETARVERSEPARQVAGEELYPGRRVA